MAYAYPVAAFDMEVKARLQAHLTHIQVTRAIAPSANTPDYARILEFCDIISRDGSGRAASTTAQCLVTIMKEESSYLVLFITLHAIELLVHNCGSYFHDMIANERFVKALIGVGGKYLKKRENFRIEDANSAKASDQIPGNQKALKYAVRMKAMALVQSLGIGFQHDARHSIFYVEYQRLVAKGIQFPVHKPTDFAPIATPAPHGAAPAPVRHVPPSGPAPVPARGGGAPNAADNFTVIKNNVTLLADMLRNNDNVSQNDLVQELASGARTVKPQVQSWIAGNTEHPSLGLALEVNDLIESTLALYAQRTSGRPSGPVGGPRIDDGKARNSPGVGGNGVGAGAGAGGKARRNSSSSSDSDSSADDDFAALSHRHGPPPPILQPISPSSSSAAAAPPSSQLPVYAYSSPAAPAPAPSAAPPAQGYPPPPQGYAPVPMYVPGPDGKPVLVYMYPPGAYPPLAAPPAGQFAPQYANANPYPSPSGPPPAPNPAYAGAAASAAPAASAPASAFAPAPQPASAPAPAAAVGASAPNPFISPATAPANAHPQPVPGAQPVYVLWPPAGGAPASPASAPPPAASPPAAAAAASASPFAPVPMPHVAPAPQPGTAPTAPNPFLGSST